MISLKAGVALPESWAMAVALIAAERVMDSLGVACVITSAADGTHKQNSLHYVGKAFDLRTRDLLQGHAEAAREKLAAALGDQFDVVLESDHIHVEFDPKNGGIA